MPQETAADLGLLCAEETRHRARAPSVPKVASAPILQHGLEEAEQLLRGCCVVLQPASAWVLAPLHVKAYSVQAAQVLEETEMLLSGLQPAPVHEVLQGCLHPSFPQACARPPLLRAQARMLSIGSGT